jgi:hypothetical protein
MADASVWVAEQVKSRQLLAMSRALRGRALWMLHQRDKDLQAMRDAIAWIEARRGGLVTSLNYGHMVDACVWLDRLDEARRHAARLFLRARQRDRLGEAEGCRALALAAAQTGQPDRAHRYLAQAERAAGARGSPHERAKNLLTRAAVAAAGGADTRRCAEDALALFESLNMSWYASRARRQMGLSGDR